MRLGRNLRIRSGFYLRMVFKSGLTERNKLFLSFNYSKKEKTKQKIINN